MSFESKKPLRTWSHLAEMRKKPSEYDIVSRKLHYSTNNPDAPWELSPDCQMNLWYKQYRNNSPLKHDDWDAFTDPDQLVYRTYNMMQDGQETHVRSLFDQFNEREHDQMIENGWQQTLATCYAPLRYLFHCLQMSSAYVQQMAPASTISNCCVLQTADNLRWLTHTAYRTHELSLTYPNIGLGENERQLWEQEAGWQGLRELMEKQLIAFDWGEAFVSLNLVVKPTIMESVLKPLQASARENNDTLLPLLIDSQLKDAERHNRWAKELVRHMLENSDNQAVIQQWIDKWQPLADKAATDYLQMLNKSSELSAYLANNAALRASLLAA
jgi:toluene monooxygenase system protein E